MRRREFIGSFCAAAVCLVAARAQQAVRRRRVAVLMQFSEAEPEGRARAQAFEQGLASSEWAIGRNVSIEYVWAVNNVEKLQGAIREFVARPPDVLVANTSREVAELQRASLSIPIVFTTVYEPVAQGFVRSLSHPGGNATGFTTIESTVGAKWLGLLKELAPSLEHATFIFDRNNPGPL